MPTHHFILAPRPAGERAQELWLQHAAGFILFEDVREYARARIDPTLPPNAREAAMKAIDDALYGVMMVIDGVTGSLRDERGTTSVELVVTARCHGGGTVARELDLREGDGMCMGYHAWREGDFGSDAVAQRR